MKRRPRPTLIERRVAKDGTALEIMAPARIVTMLRPRHVRELASWSPLLRRHGEEDAAWDWRAIIAEHRSDAKRRFESFGVVCRGQLQAAMIVGCGPHRSRVSGDPLAYVEYLASAPWNRPAIANPPTFKGAGSLMMAAAIQWSMSIGCAGALGLHAKPRAAGFYIRLGFRDFGADPQESGLHYMELNT